MKMYELPVILYWKKTITKKDFDGKWLGCSMEVYHNCATGELTAGIRPTIEAVWIPMASQFRTLSYYEYLPKGIHSFTEPCILMSIKTFASNSPSSTKFPKIRKWETERNFLITKDKKFFKVSQDLQDKDSFWIREAWVINHKSDFNYEDMRKGYGAFYHNYNDSYENPSFNEVFNLFPSRPVWAGGRQWPLHSKGGFFSWLTYIEPRLKKTGKVTKALISLGEEVKKQEKVDAPEYHHVPIDDGRLFYWEENKLNNVGVLQKISNNNLVLRCYRPLENKTLIETTRIYITEKRPFCCRLNNFDEWVPLGAVSSWNLRFILQPFDSNFLKDTPLQYLEKVLVTGCTAAQLLHVLKYPIIEQFSKLSGCEGLVAHLLAIEDFDSTFGVCKNNQMNLKAYLGVNSYQLECFRKYWSLSILIPNSNHSLNNYSVVAYLKIMFGTNVLSSIDNHTFNLAFRLFLKREGIPYDRVLSTGTDNSIIFRPKRDWDTVSDLTSLAHIGARILRVFGRASLNAFLTDVPEWIFSPPLPEVQHHYGYETSLHDYQDYLRMVEGVEDKSIWPYKIKTRQEFMHCNAEISAIFKVNTDARLRKQFCEAVDAAKKYEYTGKLFSIVAPTATTDLATEGIILSHCVQGYIKDVADKKTNILFIRRNEAKFEPFYTMEINMDGVIRQIRGNHNCDLVELSPEEHHNIVYFLNEWSVSMITKDNPKGVTGLERYTTCGKPA